MLHRSFPEWAPTLLMRLRPCLLLALSAVTSRAAEIKGTVTNAVGGEALERVEVTILKSDNS